MALDLNAALLVGTTALSSSTTALLRDASSKIPLLITPNTSIGVAAASAAVRALASTLGSAYEVSIVESHHSMKKDAPSGTALRLAQAVRDGGGGVKDDQILAMRGGDVVGEHTVRFAGAGEYVEVTHRATSRDLFARGALTAARWLSGRAPGWYTMQDVLGIKA
jgi:4-hydroxy-tetrahydrodipicolinate reductase